MGELSVYWTIFGPERWVDMPKKQQKCDDLYKKDSV